jgi:MFS family permease
VRAVDPNRGLWAPELRALTVGLVLTITFVASEALSVVTVMPVVARDLHGLRLYGFAFSAFLIGTMVGIVAAGRSADRSGPAVPYVAGILLFGAGLVTAGLAQTMQVLIAGRVLQGIGAGAVPSVAYVAIGRTLPERLRARMMAMLSTAWVVPGLAGPAVAATVARTVGWRWVFLGLLPFVALTAPFAIPALIRLGRPPGGDQSAHRLRDGIAVAVAAAMVLTGLTLTAELALGGTLIGLGVPIGLVALRRLLPPGTLTARRGLPATIATRGLLTFAFFGADAFVTLTITILRHRSVLLAGIAVTGSTLAWTAGAWIQARIYGRLEGRRLVRTGLSVILAGIAGMMLMLVPAVPVAGGIASWTVAGLGMGLCYAPISLMMLSDAPPGREGWASASLNLADVLGSALGIGIGGAAIGAVVGRGQPLYAGVGTAFVLAAAAGATALAITSRLPVRGQPG